MAPRHCHVSFFSHHDDFSPLPPAPRLPPRLQDSSSDRSTPAAARQSLALNSSSNLALNSHNPSQVPKSLSVGTQARQELPAPAPPHPVQDRCAANSQSSRRLHLPLRRSSCSRKPRGPISTQVLPPPTSHASRILVLTLLPSEQSLMLFKTAPPASLRNRGPLKSFSPSTLVFAFRNVAHAIQDDACQPRASRRVPKFENLKSTTAAHPRDRLERRPSRVVKPDDRASSTSPTSAADLVLHYPNLGV
jgi:hypothetical protein